MIKMESRISVSIPAFLSLILISILTALIVYCGNFSSIIQSYSSTSSKFEHDAVSVIPMQIIAAATDDHVTAFQFHNEDEDRRSSDDHYKPSYRKTKPLIGEEGLARARASIRTAASSSDGNLSLSNKTVNGAGRQIYRNPKAFYQSYLEMERRFKVYVYSEGEQPLVHSGPCKDIYTIEGRFIHEMENGNTKFKTNDPEIAHVYFLPFSVTWMVKYTYKPLTYDLTPLKKFISDYVHLVSTKYPFWNRTHGADHFMLACHDCGPLATQGNPSLYNNSIRALCNANSSEGFNPTKDVSIPEIHLISGKVPPKLLSPPPPSTNTTSRPFLAFFAGGLHGPIRPILFYNWKNRNDSEIKVFESLPKELDYFSFMLESKFCLCPSGYEVASPRIVEAIYTECVPVILSRFFVLPFSDVLRWEDFSVMMEVTDIPRLKEVLSSIGDDEYRRLKENLREVRKHFVLNQPAKRFDVFHMILHSIWLRRINMRL